jgi:hypothetical protein
MSDRTTTKRPGFSDHRRRSTGFQITFENGWTVSVQFGPYNYCERHDDIPDANGVYEVRPSANAEVAVLDPKGKFAPPKWWGDDVLGYQTPTDVLNLMQKVAHKP